MCQDRNIPLFDNKESDVAKEIPDIEELRNLMLSEKLKGVSKLNLPLLGWGFNNKSRHKNLRNDDMVRSFRVVLDIDSHKLGIAPTVVIAKILAMNVQPFFIHTTPSGGVRVLYWISKDVKDTYTYMEVAMALNTAVRSQCDIICDSCNKKIKQIYFINHDPNVYLNLNAMDIEVDFIATYHNSNGANKQIADTRKNQDNTDIDSTFECLRVRKEFENRTKGINFLPQEEGREDEFRGRKNNWESVLRDVSANCANAEIPQEITERVCIGLFEADTDHNVKYLRAKVKDAYKSIASQKKRDEAEREQRGEVFAQIADAFFKVDTDDIIQWSEKGIKTYFKSKGIKDFIPELTFYPGGFVNIPNNIEYKRVYKNAVGDDCFNTSKIPPHNPINDTDCLVLKGYFKHLVGDGWDYEKMLDYLTLIVFHPTQRLQCLVLTSREGMTGKSTLLRILSLMIGESNVLSTSFERISSRFTDLWANKQIIFCEESSTDKKEQNELIKYLCTTNTVTLESKGLKARQVPFYGKVILANNEEDRPIYLDKLDRRYTILRVPKLEKINPNFMQDAKWEMGAFLQFLKNRKLSCKGGFDLYFSPEEIETKYTTLAKIAATPNSETMLDELLGDIQSTFPEITTFVLPICDISEFARIRGYSIKPHEMSAMLRRRSISKTIRNPEHYTFSFEGWTIKKEKGRFRLWEFTI